MSDDSDVFKVKLPDSSDYGYTFKGPASAGDYDYLAFYDDPEEAFAGNICHQFEYSISFFVLIAITGFVFGLFSVVLYRRRRMQFFYGFDILYLLLFIVSAIQFTPTIYQAFEVHGYGSNTQTGCKLMAFTSIGLQHVITFLVSSLVIYAWLGVGKARSGWDFDAVDRALRRHFAWFLMLLFAIEGATGMMPSIYMDVGSDGKCNATQTSAISPTAYVVAHSMLQVFLPYLIPFALMVYPLMVIVRNMGSIGEEMHKANAKTIVILAVTFIATHSPVAILSIIVIPTFMAGVYIDWHTACTVEGFFAFIEDVWYIFAPLLILLRDPELGASYPGKELAERICKKISSKTSFSTGSRNNSNQFHGSVLSAGPTLNRMHNLEETEPDT